MSEALARRFLLGALSRIRGGRLELAEGGRRLAFGAPGSELSARVEIRDPRAYRWALRGGTGLGEGYVDRLWSTDDLVALIRICCRNLPPWDRWRRRLHPLVGPLQRAVELVPRNTRPGRPRTSRLTTTSATSCSSRSSTGG